MVVALGAGSLVLRPTPEVVDAGRWRGDGTGTTSTHAAHPERIVWITPRLGVGPTDTFRQEHVIPVGAHEDLVLGVSGGQLLAVDTGSGDIRWEREVAGQIPTLVGDRLLLPLGPGIAELDATTGDELSWLPTRPEEGVPSHVVGADDGTVVVAGRGEDRRPALSAYDREGAHLWSWPSGGWLPWSDDGRPALLLSTPDGASALTAGSLAALTPVSEPLPDIHAAGGGWVAAHGADGALIHQPPGGPTLSVPFERVTAVHPTSRGVVVFGFRRPPPTPPRGALEAVRIDPETGTTTPVLLSAGFGDILDRRSDGVIARSGSLVRMVGIGPRGPFTRWEHGGLDPGVDVTVVGDVVAHLGRGRWFGVATDTGRIRFDVDVAGIPEPGAWRQVRSQPYLRPDGSLIDASDTLTQVVDARRGVRVDVRGSVHIASTPRGDVAQRGDVVELVDGDGRPSWRIEARGAVHPGGIAVTDAHVALVTQFGEQTSTLDLYDLEDGSPRGDLTSPPGFWNEAYRIDDGLILVTGDTTALVAVGPDGPRLQWHAPGSSEPQVTPIVVGDELVLLGRSWAERLDLGSGRTRELQRLPRYIDPVVAHDGGTAVATSGAEVVAVDLSSLEEVWATDVGARLTSAPTLAGDRIYVGTGSGQVVVLDRDGTITDRLETGFTGAVVGAPTVADGSVYVFAADGHQLVAFGGG